MLKFFNLNKTSEFYQLSKEEENAIKIAKEDMKQGNSYSQKEVDEKLQKWIEK